MKKFLKYATMFAVATAMLPMVSCDDDDTVDPYDINYCYLYQPYETFANVEYKANGDFMSGLTDPLELVPVRLTKPAPSNIQVEVAIDPSLIDEYNEANNTEYTLLEGAEIVNPIMTIAAGEYTTPEAITISFTDHHGFIDQENDLILPVVIRSAGNAVISKSSRVFLTFNSTYNPLVITTKASQEFAACPLSQGWESKVQTVTVNNAITLNYSPYENLTVDLKLDASKVADYNAAHGTNYIFKSDAKLASDKITVTPDEVNGSFTINSGSLSDFENGQSYVLPVVVSNPQGCQSQLNEANNVVYVVLRSAGPELVYSTTTVEGTEFTMPAGITCTVNGQDSYSGGWSTATWVDIINPESYSYGYMKTTDVMEINFGEVVNLSGFYFDCYASYYAPRSISLQTSKDGSNWTEWEVLSWSPAAGQFYISLPFASETQYIKLSFPTGSNNMDIECIRFYAN